MPDRPNPPKDYKTYQRILWLDTMKSHGRRRIFTGPPTVSNILANIATQNARKFRKYRKPEAKENFGNKCWSFEKVMIPEYIKKKDEKVLLTEENSCVIGDGYYKRDREEHLLEITNSGYKRFAYLNLLNRRSHEVLDEFSISPEYYDVGSILSFKRNVSVNLDTQRIVRFKKNKKSNLPVKARRKIDLDVDDIESHAEYLKGLDSNLMV